MRRFWGLAATTALLAVACAGTSSPSPPPPPPNGAGPTRPPGDPNATTQPVTADPELGYVTVPCDLPAVNGRRPGYLESCGILRVPENRSKPGSRLIELHVVIVGSKDADPVPDPVVIVAHGAGGETIRPFLDSPAVAALRSHRKVILVDGRGTGRSTPSLDCPEMDDVAVESLTTFDRTAVARLQRAALEACRDRLIAAGFDLDGYTTREIAADMVDLRTALGYATWNLFGVSYATIEEQAVMRLDPGGIRSVILDSVKPPDVDALAEWGPNAETAIEQLFDACAADADCASAHPDLAETFDRLVARLDAQPLSVTFDDPWSSVTRHGIATGDTLVTAVFNALYVTREIGGIPGRIESIETGGTDLLGRQLALEAHAFAAEAAYFRVYCADDFRWTDGLRIEEAAQAIERPGIAAMFTFWATWSLGRCEIFRAERGDPADRVPVSSDIPTLILSGALDPITPAAWGERVLSTLSGGTQVVFPGVGHGVLGTNACAEKIANLFLTDPTAAVNPACAAGLGWPVFRD